MEQITKITLAPVLIQNIPVILQGGFWCVWKAKPKKNRKVDKIPRNRTGVLSTSSTEGWMTFREACELYAEGKCHGIGRLCDKDGFVVVDLDNCLVNGEWIIPDELKALGPTYIEVSPSMKGLRLVYKVDDIPDRDVVEPFEIYSGNTDRFLTFTGQAIGSPRDIAELNGQMAKLVATLGGGEAHTPAAPVAEVVQEDPFAFEDVPDFSVDEIKDILSHVDPDSGYHTWYMVVQALHHQFKGGADGMKVLDDWSKLSDDYDLAEIKKCWATLTKKYGEHPNPVTMRSVKQLADKSSVVIKKEVEGLGSHVITDEYLETPHRARWIVKGVLERGCVTQLFGPSGVGKSFVTIDMVCCIASGLDWAGHKVKQGGVLYVPGEGHSGVVRRMAAWRMEHPGADLTRLRVMDQGVDLNDEDDLKLLKANVESGFEGGVSMIVFDTLGRAIPGVNENDAGEMGKILQRLTAISDHYDITIMNIHHSGKGDQSESRGSSAIKAAMDVEMRVRPGIGRSLVLESNKTKDGEPFEPIGFKMLQLQLPENFNDEDGDVMTSCVLERDDSVVDDAAKAATLSSAGLMVMRAFDEVYKDHRVEKAPVPADITVGLGMDAPGDGLWESDVRDRFNASQPEDKPGTVRLRWKRGVEDCVSKEALILRDSVIVKL